ncbi:hypothetical phage protein [Sodalis glossinidius str. 'morsitans']|uniref:Hypothetical phage protein n=1 Tax=Sodalis glossinidius (strain morsitans) TaxID=343509 RepID=Q2NTP5_SODGM|nr:hypothetical phage protein [Sodalis glossinidius str. 'morsitans']
MQDFQSRIIPIREAITSARGACLPVLLTGCGHTQTRYLFIPPTPIPAELLDDCPPPVIPEHMTWGDSVILNEQLLLALEMCNQDKTALRQIEAQNHDEARKTATQHPLPLSE